MISCAECSREFDLARQHYYDNVCPSCKDDRVTWPGCFRCSERIPPEERATVTVRGRTGTERLPAHESCAEEYEEQERRY